MTQKNDAYYSRLVIFIFVGVIVLLMLFNNSHNSSDPLVGTTNSTVNSTGSFTCNDDPTTCADDNQNSNNPNYGR